MRPLHMCVRVCVCVRAIIKTLTSH